MSCGLKLSPFHGIEICVSRLLPLFQKNLCESNLILILTDCYIRLLST